MKTLTAALAAVTLACLTTASALADGLLSGESEVRGLDVESLRALLMS